FRRHHEAVLRAAGKPAGAVPRRVLIHETIRGMINEVVTDLVETSRRNLRRAAPMTADDVRARARPLIGLSPGTLADHLALKRYLRRHLYRNEQVLDVTSRAQRMLKAVFQRFLADLKSMPPEHAARARAWEAKDGDAGRARAVADYVAGMTDRYAFSAYRRLVDPKARLP
ncbi:MAG: deoxyguanosinetriphosphate triphosphohydrolase, partial [Gammaproteobacteria bacterium]|nr:deoxyguanosinetriphosphate triphosphohydrolase [Gammaproteobacteria bacterium]